MTRRKPTEKRTTAANITQPERRSGATALDILSPPPACPRRVLAPESYHQPCREVGHSPARLHNSQASASSSTPINLNRVARPPREPRATHLNPGDHAPG